MGTIQRDEHRVSVIIPTLGRDTLMRCRAALAKQTRMPDQVIVVVDHDRRGAAWARNQGLRQAMGDLVAFTDDDCVPPEDWLERLVMAIDRHNAACAGGTFEETDPLLQDIRKRRPAPMEERVNAVGLVGNSGHIMFKREWLDRCAQQDGYVFDESFSWSGEDWELIWRLRRRGARFVYVPAPVMHLRRVTPLQFFRHQFQRGMGIAQLYMMQHSVNSEVIAQDSLLWGEQGKKAEPRWLRAIWRKIVGPFDVGSFERKRHFWMFWLGEKCQSMGFLGGILRNSIAGRPERSSSTNTRNSKAA